MTIPVVQVAVTLVGPDSNPIVGAQVSALLSAPIVYQGVVLPVIDTQVTDSSGKCTLTIVPTDVGSSQVTYSFEIWPPFSPQPTEFTGIAVPSNPASTTLNALLGDTSGSSTTIHYMSASQYMTGSLYIG